MPKLKSRRREMFAIEVAAMAPLASSRAVPEVAARIDELLAQFAKRSGIYAEYVQRKLLPIVERITPT
jgi:hypothetical protein